MNLEEIYQSLDVEKMAKRWFQDDLKHFQELNMLNRASKEKSLKQVHNTINEALAANPNTPAEVLKELMENDSFKRKNLLAENPNTPSDILYQLYDMGYSHSLVKNPNAPTEMLQQIYDNTINNPEKISREYNPNIQIFYDIAQNPNAPQEVLRTLSTSREGISGSETIQKAVAKNPSTPLDILEGLDKNDVLQNPNIPVDLMNKIINMQDKHDYQFEMERLPSLYTPEYVSKLKRENGIKSLDSILVQNPNISPDILQIIDENLKSNPSDYEFVLSDLLKNPNTPSSIIEKYANRINYNMIMPGSLYSVPYSIVQNPNTPPKVLEAIKIEIEKQGNDANCRYVFRRYYENPNIPKDILQEVIQKAIVDGKEEMRAFIQVLKNPKVFEILKDREMSKTFLQQKEEELSSLEVEEKKISEAETLIEQQKEGQDIGE